FMKTLSPVGTLISLAWIMALRFIRKIMGEKNLLLRRLLFPKYGVYNNPTRYLMLMRSSFLTKPIAYGLPLLRPTTAPLHCRININWKDTAGNGLYGMNRHTKILPIYLLENIP